MRPLKWSRRYNFFLILKTSNIFLINKLVLPSCIPSSIMSPLTLDIFLIRSNIVNVLNKLVSPLKSP